MDCLPFGLGGLLHQMVDLPADPPPYQRHQRQRAKRDKFVMSIWVILIFTHHGHIKVGHQQFNASYDGWPDFLLVRYRKLCAN